MAGEIVRSYIGFGLNNFPGQLAPVQSSNKNFTQQIGSNIQCGAGIKGAGKLGRRIRRGRKD